MASTKTWFVQTGFGTVLGPMPTDVLREMVRTGEMVRSDQVRKGSGGRWHPASEIPGLFDAIATSDSEQPPAEPPIEVATPIAVIDATPLKLETNKVEPSVSDSIPQTTETPAIEPAASAPTAIFEADPPRVSSVKGRLIPPPMPFVSAMSASPPIHNEPPVAAVAETDAASREVKPLAELPIEPPNNDASEIRSAPPEVDLISRWREERDRSREELGTASLAAEMTSSSDVEDFAPELPADLLDDDDDSKVSAPIPASSIFDSTTRRRTIDKPAFLKQVAGLDEGPRVPDEPLAKKWDRWRRSLPDLRIAGAVVVVLFVAWWFWPRSSRGIHDRYVAIWSEWKTRRADLKDTTGWEQFLKRTEKELNASVPYLEKQARASDRESQLLLFIGRDCLQKMLTQPRQVGSPRENQMQTLFAVLHDMHDPPANGKRLEAVIEPPRMKSKTADPKRTVDSQDDPSHPRPLKDEQLPSSRRPVSTVAPIEVTPLKP